MHRFDCIDQVVRYFEGMILVLDELWHVAIYLHQAFKSICYFFIFLYKM